MEIHFTPNTCKVLIIIVAMLCSTSMVNNYFEHSDPIHPVTEPETEKPVTIILKGNDPATCQFIEKYSPLALKSQERDGIPASIKMAQAIVEGRSGTSYLARNANNHFGIKTVKAHEPGLIRKDDTANDSFRVYLSPEASFDDHGIFLRKWGRYTPLFNLPKTDYKAWAKGLKKAGYATDIEYDKKLIAIIETYGLNGLDTL